MANGKTIPDADVRYQAATTFDRNVVVVAGAGTGKTTLLVNRLIHLLMREPEPVKITEVVALTFTNKAANEMKLRLRERLLALLVPDQCPITEAEPWAAQLDELRNRYGLSSQKIADRAQAALQDLEKAQIGTLHSFAAHLIRLHPIESGVDPNFEEDDGLRFDEHFAAHWDLWLDRELGANGGDHDRWRRLLTRVGLAQLRNLAHALCSELILLDDLTRQIEDSTLPPPLDAWLARKQTRVADFLRAQDQRRQRNIEVLLRSAHALFGLVLNQGLAGISALDGQSRAILTDKEPGSRPPAGWPDDAFAEARDLIGVARSLLAVDHELLRELLALLLPLVQTIRRTFLEQGWISFDGLLAKARGLLRDHPHVRERLKRDYQALLVDEFQDTDPIQYEIVLYLAERAGHCARTWQDVELQPGKLFIVGDPKQSIYAFRRADIEAFQRVLDKIERGGGVVYKLVTNFRSHGDVLLVLNEVFDRLLQPQEHLQPPNVRLLARPNRQGGMTRTGVELRLVTAPASESEFDAATATRAEAEALARWLSEEVLARERLTDAQGETIPLKPGHVALLFRKLTQAQDYLDALRRYRIPYVTDGEKHFYRRQEVIDLVNLLRVVANPHDTVALVGVLRSPLGGVTDRELYELRERDALDYRRADRLSGWISPRAQAVGLLYERLAELHRTAPSYPLEEAIELVFHRVPILELAAASLHGEQAVANLIKIRQIAAELADRPHLSLAGFVELMVARLAEQPEEAESALEEESLEAVRVLTIHKAKGLEFPVVILPGLHHGANRGSQLPLISADWSTGLLGLSVGERCSLGAVFVHEKLRAREDAERRRILYVGMTRAKERLVLSGGLLKNPSRETFLTLLEEAGGELATQEEALQIGGAALALTVVTAPERIQHRRMPGLPALEPAPDWSAHLRRWEERERVWAVTRAAPARLVPSRITETGAVGAAPSPGGPADRELSRLIGTLAHRVLEHWDFAAAPEGLDGVVQRVCRTAIPPEFANQAEDIAAELGELLRAFTRSEPYKELSRATILGREVPFAIPWNGDRLGARGYGAGRVQPDSCQLPVAHRPSPGACVMEGVIDLLYRLDGEVWIADYKTDRVQEDDLATRVAEYQVQVGVYKDAVARCLGLEKVKGKLVFLRSGTAVEV